MNAAERRSQILQKLRGAEKPLSATALAGELSVSRQIIVGDVALLRASGEEIVATPRGYVLEGQAGGARRAVACCHRGEDMERELNLMVDHGCVVENVVVEHSLYGQLVGQLSLSSRYDVAEFIRRVSESDAKPLSDLTHGIHIHTLRCPDESVWQALLAALEREGFLVEADH